MQTYNTAVFFFIDYTVSILSNALVTPLRNSPSCKNHIKQFFVKLSGMWLSLDSYRVYMAVTGSTPHSFRKNCLAWLIQDGYVRENVTMA